MAEVTGADHEQILCSNGYTYSGHPVCCAAALENIRIIEDEGLLDHVRAVAPRVSTRASMPCGVTPSSATRAGSAWSAALRAGRAGRAIASRATSRSAAVSIGSARSWA
jgi:acetylornithine/succinyldiaminopimelate/putrescine aminotransferase